MNMTWLTHIAGGFFLYRLFHGGIEPVTMGLCLFGSIFPDWMEGPPGRRWLKHRGLSHSILLWLAVALLIPFLVPEGFLTFVKYFLLGVTSHLLLDSLTVYGVPLFRERTVGFRIVKTGKVSEIVVLFVIFLSLLFL